MSRIYTFFFGVLFLLLGASPAHAQVASTTATLPSCGATTFTSHVYSDGVLHSFDYTLSGTSSLPLIATVGDMQLDMRYSTVWRGATSTKIHVDVPRWNGFKEVTPVTLKASGCAEQTFVVLLPKKAPIIPIPSSPITPAALPKTPVSVPVQPTPPKQPTTESPTAPVYPRPSSEGNGSVNTATTGNDGLVSRILSGLKDDKQVVATPSTTVSPTKKTGQCTTPAPALWIAFLIAHLVASIVILNNTTFLLQGNGWRFSAALFAPFIAMLGIWFLFDGCRSYQWFPILTTLFTLVTLLAPTFFTQERAEGMVK
jgi:hypothetical protein